MTFIPAGIWTMSTGFTENYVCDVGADVWRGMNMLDFEAMGTFFLSGGFWFFTTNGCIY